MYELQWDLFTAYTIGELKCGLYWRHPLSERLFFMVYYNLEVSVIERVVDIKKCPQIEVLLCCELERMYSEYRITEY